ncbi:fasciclin-like arabinogalactan protein 9 [Ananas comosus]|uniref:Fasciclin-like arabinogalactan protein 9 n=1 Tax=Ananas comosus TaxID=4615 RepID=A0A6P5F2V1_ANACO|nr:fasciclin-like arabinogalactan protein 9 [Ananas comosus]
MHVVTPMASFQNPSLPLAFFLAITAAFLTNAAAAVAAPAPSPSPAAIDITGILDKGSQYTTFKRLLKATEAYQEILTQLDDSSDGVTLLAPTDDAFKALKPGTLNKLTAQDESELVLYHVLPQYYTFDSFATASNPVRTQASGYDGVDTVNVTSTGVNQVYVSTGVVGTTITNAVYLKYPVAVYSLEKVLLPNELFGPESSRRPLNSPPAPAAKPKNGTAAAQSSENDQSNSASENSLVKRRIGWGFVVGFVLARAMGLL